MTAKLLIPLMVNHYARGLENFQDLFWQYQDETKISTFKTETKTKTSTFKTETKIKTSAFGLETKTKTSKTGLETVSRRDLVSRPNITANSLVTRIKDIIKISLQTFSMIAPSSLDQV